MSANATSGAQHKAPGHGPVALFGAAGRTGRRVLARLLARGTRVRALVGDASRLAPHSGLDVVEGDARDADAVARTLAGVSAAIVTLGMRDITRPDTSFSAAVRTIVDGARAAGVGRIVAVASAGALPDPRGGLASEHAPPGPYANVNAEHARNYRTLEGSGLDWTLLCAVDLVDDIPEGRARLAYDALPAGSGETGYEDLAATIVALLGEPASFGRRVGIVSDR
jgi:putative NADH-flavin reductase